MDQQNFLILERGPDDSGSRVTGLDKTIISITITIVFIILAMPIVYRLTNKATSLVGIKSISSKGIPTVVGTLIHAVIFFFIVRMMMQ